MKAMVLCNICNMEENRTPLALMDLPVPVPSKDIFNNVWFFKGRVFVDSKTAVKVEFGCALTGTGPAGGGSG